MPRRTCTQCGQSFLLPSPGQWLYKRVKKKNGNSRTMYFCSYTCERDYNKVYPKKDRHVAR